jgi:tetratricopeptide (TPR) repeat protein
MRESLAIFRNSLPENHPYIATGEANLGRTLIELNRWNEAESTLRKAIALETEALGADSEEVAVAGISLARALAAKKQFDEAEPLFHRGYETLLRTRGPSANRTLQTRQWITEFYARRGRAADADKYFSEVEASRAQH